MKKIILIFALIFVSCTKEEPECFCDINIIIVEQGQGQTGSYTISNVPKECGTEFDWFNFKEQNNIPDNHWFRSADCD